MDPIRLFDAIQRDDILGIKRLLEQGANANGRHNLEEGGYEIGEDGRLRVKETSLTPLCAAIKRNSLEAVQLLLHHGADPNIVPTGEETPLALAASIGNLAILQSLLQAGAEVDTRGISGRTALLWAVRMNRPPAVEMLLNAGAEGKVEALRWAIDLDRQTIQAILRAHGTPEPEEPVNADDTPPDIFANPRKFNREA
jgi:ankyrin repeat protein